MLKRFKEFYEELAVRRKGVFNKFAAIVFVNQSRLGEAAGMFANRFFIGVNCFYNIIECKAAVGRNKHKYLDAAVVGNSF